MITGKTSSGFDFHLDEEKTDDYEFLEMVCEIDNGKVSLIPKMAIQLLGKDQMDALKEHVRDSDGKVSARKIADEIGEIMANSKVKNS